MSDSLDRIKAAVARIQGQDPHLAAEMNARRSSPAAAEEAGGLESMLAETPGAPPVSRELVLETIVLRVGRPVLAIQQNEPVLEFRDADSEIWRDRLAQAHDRLTPAIRAVGRVNLANNADFEWLGTGWLVDDDIVVTNRHVAHEFAERHGEGFVFRMGFDGQRLMSSSLDFLQEVGRPDRLEFSVQEILYIEDEPGPDMAFLRVQATNGDAHVAEKIPLSSARAGQNQQVAAIGYPARDSRIPDQALMEQIFGNVYDKKRLAPGQITGSDDATLTHDCSTLGGNSGSALIDLETGQAVALHFAGRFLLANYAVPADLVADGLRRIRGESSRRRARTTAPRPADGGIPAPTPAAPPPITPAPAEAWATWTVPLQVSVRLGAPVAAFAGQPTFVPSTGGAPPPGSASSGATPPAQGDIHRAVEAARQALRGRPDVVAVRAGYRFRNGWITKEPAVVVAVTRKLPAYRLREQHIQAIPSSFLGVGVDVRPASPLDVLGITEAAELERALPRIHYKPPQPPGMKEVNDTMSVICHVSPDAGWPQLEAFLGRIRKQLVVGMYDFSAPHVFDALRKAVRPAERKLFMTIQKGCDFGDGVKANDIDEDEVIQKLHQALGNRFQQAWASVTGPERLFANSYHIKVAVRDSEEFWLSSGNWQSSNQPPYDPLGAGDQPADLLTKYNREWHAVIRHPGLAKDYERYLLKDLKDAEALEAVPAELPEFVIPAAYAEAIFERRDIPARFFPPLTDTRKTHVQPLLTPDNYQEHVLDVIRKAQEKLYFQNQSLKPLKENDPRFEELLDALLDRQRAGLDVRIIFREFYGVAQDLENLQAAGFNMDQVRAQPNCHTKGIIADSSTVVLGSHNWTNSGTLVNRDASLIFFDEAIARYFESVFLFDWEHLAQQRIDESRPAPRPIRPGEPTPEGMARLSWQAVMGA